MLTIYRNNQKWSASIFVLALSLCNIRRFYLFIILIFKSISFTSPTTYQECLQPLFAEILILKSLVSSIFCFFTVHSQLTLRGRMYIFFFSCFGGSVGAPSIPLYTRSTMTIYLLWKHNEVINTYTAIMMTKMTHNIFFILFIVSATLWLHLFICKNCNYKKISISISQLPSAQLSNCFSRRADVMSAHAADGLHAEQRRP